ncbi:MAG: PRTRC system protein C [Oleiphilus sp.]|nr:MAG: PRTRC system protein C [Oleiphilus sp.]
MVRIIEQTRVFQYCGTELPDPDPALSKEDVLLHYANSQYPELRRGKVEQIAEEGDRLVFELTRAKFQPDG